MLFGYGKFLLRIFFWIMFLRDVGLWYYYFLVRIVRYLVFLFIYDNNEVLYVFKVLFQVDRVDLLMRGYFEEG